MGEKLVPKTSIELLLWSSLIAGGSQKK